MFSLKVDLNYLEGVIKTDPRFQKMKDKFVDIGKLKLLQDIINRNYKYMNAKKFVLKFYFDEQLTLIYLRWLEAGKNPQYKPSLDHKISKSNGGTWELENLHFITWFENRVKWNMNWDEWKTFQKETETSSKLFLLNHTRPKRKLVK